MGSRAGTAQPCKEEPGRRAGSLCSVSRVVDLNPAGRAEVTGRSCQPARSPPDNYLQ